VAVADHNDGVTSKRYGRRWTTSAAATGLVVLSVVAWPGAAKADPKGGCPLGRVCLYPERGFTGRPLVVDPAGTGGGDLREAEAGPCTAADVPVWSATNRTGPRASMPRYRLVLFRTADCGDRAASVGPEAARENTAGSRSFHVECIESGGCRRGAALFR